MRGGGGGVIWRVLNPTGRDYTYSPLHHMYSTLDLFLISHHLLTWHPMAEIASPLWLDHAPVYFPIKFPNAPKRFSSWKIIDNLLKDQLCLSDLRTSTQTFLEVHANELGTNLVPFWTNLIPDFMIK